MLKYDIENMRWFCYKKLSNNQTAVIVFDKYWQNKTDNRADYQVLFAISNKKKILKQWIDSSGYGNLDMQTTGNGGTEGLVWAFDMIKYFIKVYLSEEDRIIVKGSDNRRFKIYEHFLESRLGFEKVRDPEWGMCLVKAK